MNYYKEILFIIAIITLIGCQKELEAERASFISIEDFKYSTNDAETIPFSGNYESIKISDCWVTLNGSFLGAFEMPSQIPVLFDGEVNARISPGIKVNGVDANRIIYPFYKIYEISTELNFEENTAIYPVTEYKEDVDLDNLLGGSFELGNILTATEYSDTISSYADPIIQSDQVFQGQKSCAIYLDNETPHFQIQNIEEIIFENQFETIFLELDFKSSVPFSMGIITNEDLVGRDQHMVIFTSNEWKKLYLDISPLIGTGNPFSTYNIYFEGTLPENMDSGYVLLDNIKIVH